MRHETWHGVLAKIAALTEQEVDHFGEELHESLVDTLKGPPGKGSAEPFADTTPAKLADEVDAFVWKE